MVLLRGPRIVSVSAIIVEPEPLDGIIVNRRPEPQPMTSIDGQRIATSSTRHIPPRKWTAKTANHKAVRKRNTKMTMRKMTRTTRHNEEDQGKHSKIAMADGVVVSLDWIAIRCIPCAAMLSLDENAQDIYENCHLCFWRVNQYFTK